MQYTYSITAVNDYGESIKSNEVHGIPGLPSKPLNLTAIAGYGYINLTWHSPASPGASPIIYYKIYRIHFYPPLCPPGPEYWKELLTIVAGNQHYYNDTNVTNGKRYSYAVSAVNSMGEGPMSNISSATPGRVPTPPLNFSVKIKDGVANISWEKPKDNGGAIWGYHIYCNGKLIGKVWKDRMYYKYKLPQSGKYVFYVTAVNFKGESKASEDVVIIYQEKTPAIDWAIISVSTGLFVVSLIAAIVARIKK